MSKETTNFLIYNLPDEELSVDVVVKDENIWISQKGMAELFGIDRTGIGKHLKNIFSDGELDEEVVCANFSHTTEHGAIEGKTQLSNTKLYNLDAIISVGYRVNSYKATKFRIWATSVLKEYMQKGFVLDDERLKQGQNIFRKDYFNKGRISKSVADEKAKLEYDEFNKFQKIVSDFDKMFMESLGKVPKSEQEGSKR